MLLAVVVAALASALLVALLSGDHSAGDSRRDAIDRDGLIAALVPISVGAGAGPNEAVGRIEGQLEAAPGAISVVPDPLDGDEPVFRITVDEDDVYPLTPTENPRAQILTRPVIEPGDEFWLWTKFMLPEDLPPVPGWMSLISIYGPPFDGSSPWQIGIRADELLWQRNITYEYDIPWRTPLMKGRWVEVLMHQHLASDGWVEMWIDGREVTFADGSQRIAMATLDSSNEEGPNHAKIMQYREADMFDSATVYFGPLRIGESQASVDG